MEKENENDKKVDASDIIADIYAEVLEKLNENLIEEIKNVVKHEETHSSWKKSEVDKLFYNVDKAYTPVKNFLKTIDDESEETVELVQSIVTPLSVIAAAMYKSETLANYFGHKACEIWYTNVDELFGEAYSRLPKRPQIIKGNCLLNTYEPVHIQEFDDSSVTIEGNAFYRRANGEYVVKMDGKTFVFDGNNRFIPCKTHLPDANKNILTWRYTILSDILGRKLDELAKEEISLRNTVDMLNRFAKPMTLVAFNILDEDKKKNTFMHYSKMIKDRIDTFPIDERYILLKKEQEKLLQASLDMDEVKHAFENYTWEVKTNEKGMVL